MIRPWKPTREQIEAARNERVDDVIDYALDILFVGINPGLYTAAIGHHFGRPGNRFWPALHRSGMTDRELSPFEEEELLELGIGVTNIVNRATASASELTLDELRAGGRALVRKVKRYKPQVVAFLGLSAYRAAFGRTKASVGPQEEWIGDARVWVLPNPSGLNAHYQLDDFADLFGRLRDATAQDPSRRRRTGSSQ